MEKLRIHIDSGMVHVLAQRIIKGESTFEQIEKEYDVSEAKNKLREVVVALAVVKHPAVYLAHWVTGAVPCCEKHCKEILNLGELLGAHVPVSFNKNFELECTNCIDQQKSSK